MIKVSVISGVLGGLLFLPFYYLLGAMGYNPLGFYSFLDLWIPALAIVLAIYFYRRNQPGGELHLWEGLIIGFITNTLIAVFSGISLYLFFENFDTDGQLMQSFLEETKQRVMAQKDDVIKRFGEESYNKILNSEGVTTESLGKDEAIRKFVYGFFMVPIISMLLRKKAFDTTK